MSQENIIRRIQKLLELSNNPNEHEASAAAAKVTELLAQYNLDMAVIRQTAVAGGTVVAEEKREKTKVNRSAMYAWQRELWYAIAEANFCWHWVAEELTGKYSSTGSPVFVKRHVILGSESNAKAATILGEYLCDAIERLLPFENKDRLSRSAISWRMGCAAKLQERIRTQTQELKSRQAEAGAATNALTLRDVFQREYEANYDAQYGKGAYARSQARDAEWNAARAEREAQRAQEAAAEEAERVAALANETEAQRERRLKREKKEEEAQNKRDERHRNAYWNKRYRENAKIDRSAYRQGTEAGASISLSKQVDTKSAANRKEIA
jgi:hypothetical protein